MAITENFFYLTDGTVSGNTISGDTYTVKIFATEIKNSFDNSANSITLVVPPAEQEKETGADAAKNPKTFILNLLAIKRVISVKGYLEDNQAADGNIPAAAIGKKNSLIHLQYKGGDIRAVWGVYNSTPALNTRLLSPPSDGTSTYVYTGVTGTIIKMETTESPGAVSAQLGNSDYKTAGTHYPIGVRKFEVMLQFQIGVHKF